MALCYPWRRYASRCSRGNYPRTCPLGVHPFAGLSSVSCINGLVRTSGSIHPCLYVGAVGFGGQEAMAPGLPVLVYNRCGCAPDLVAAEENGYTFDPTDVEALAGAMQHLASDDCDLEAMGCRSHKIIGRWTPETFARGLCGAASASLAAPRKPFRLRDRPCFRVDLRKGATYLIAATNQFGGRSTRCRMFGALGLISTCCTCSFPEMSWLLAPCHDPTGTRKVISSIAQPTSTSARRSQRSGHGRVRTQAWAMRGTSEARSKRRLTRYWASAR